MDSSAILSSNTTSEQSVPPPPPTSSSFETTNNNISKNKMDTNVNDEEEGEEEETSSTSSNGKLKIDLAEDSSSNQESSILVEKTHASKRMRTKTPEKSKETSKEKTILETPTNTSSQNEQKATTSSTTATTTRSSRSNAEVEVEVDEKSSSGGKKSTTPSRRTTNRGLDGGYWSRIGTETTAETNSNERRKRQRVATDRLDLSVYRHNLSADESMMSDDTVLNTTITTRGGGASSTLAGDLDSDGSEMNVKTTTTTVSPKQTSTSPHRQNRLFKAKSFLTVRNETDGFYLCRAVNAVYEESKKCKVQWLEDVAPNKYTFSVVDFIQPMTIITKVSVKRCPPDEDDGQGGPKGLISIEEKDLERVKNLLEKIKETGHLTVDSSELEDSDQQTNSDEASSKASGKRVAKFLDNDEFFDKEDAGNDEKK